VADLEPPPPFFSANNVFKTIDGNKIPDFAPKIAEQKYFTSTCPSPFENPGFAVSHIPGPASQKINIFIFISKNCSVIPMILF
jgi:hypothetical protein